MYHNQELLLSFTKPLKLRNVELAQKLITSHKFRQKVTKIFKLNLGGTTVLVHSEPDKLLCEKNEVTFIRFQVMTGARFKIKNGMIFIELFAWKVEDNNIM